MQSGNNGLEEQKVGVEVDSWANKERVTRPVHDETSNSLSIECFQMTSLN